MGNLQSILVTACRGCRYLYRGMEGDSCRRMPLNDWLTRDSDFHVNRSIHPLCPYNVKKQKETNCG